MLYGIRIDEDDNDIEYVPTVQEERSYDRQKRIIRPKVPKSRSIQEIWEELKQQQNVVPPSLVPKSALQIAHEVLAAQKKEQFQKVLFAGKEFIINSKGEVIETVASPPPEPHQPQPQALFMTPQELQQSFKAYHEFLKKISSKVKKINSIGKSKLDWNDYKQKQNIQSQMEQNRKAGGVLEKKKFIEHSNKLKKIKL